MSLLATSITAAVALVMMYTGMSVSPRRLREILSRGDLKNIAWLAAVNYAVIPLAVLVFAGAGGQISGLGLALLILAVLPCAPLVPSLVALLDEAPEWAILVFIVFSLVSLVGVVLLTVLLDAGGYIAGAGQPHGQDLYRGLAGYLAAVFVPLLLGMLLRVFTGAWQQSLLRVLRPVAGISLLVTLLAFVVVNRTALLGVSLRDMAIIAAFNVFCIALVFPYRRAAGDRWLAGLLTTGFRNIALAMPFSMVVLGSSEVPVYIMVYVLAALVTCVPAVIGARLVQGRG